MVPGFEALKCVTFRNVAQSIHEVFNNRLKSQPCEYVVWRIMASPSVPYGELGRHPVSLNVKNDHFLV